MFIFYLQTVEDSYVGNGEEISSLTIAANGISVENVILSGIFFRFFVPYAGFRDLSNTKLDISISSCVVDWWF
jgi:hypothetical protein